MRLTKLLQKAGINIFFLLLLLAVLLAWLAPQFGTEQSPIPLKGITNAGVALIFFFYGLRLSIGKLISGLTNWKLHVSIHVTTFLFFPALVLLLRHLFYSSDFEIWWLGTFYLAVLPSTVSSSVVMISIAGGNIPAGVFNASLSSIIGIFITPAWISSVIGATAASDTNFSAVILDLVLQVLIPLVAGVLLNRYVGSKVEKYKDLMRNFDQLIILLIVYRAFSESFHTNMFSEFGTMELLTLALLMLGLFLLVAALMKALASYLHFSKEDYVTLLFCGSKKSLVQGAVMGQVLFTNASTFGLILLPLMLYHTLQLLAGSVIAQRLRPRQ